MNVNATVKEMKPALGFASVQKCVDRRKEGAEEEKDQLRGETERGPDYGARQDPALMSWPVSHRDFLHVTLKVCSDCDYTTACDG